MDQEAQYNTHAKPNRGRNRDDILSGGTLEDANLEWVGERVHNSTISPYGCAQTPPRLEAPDKTPGEDIMSSKVPSTPYSCFRNGQLSECGTNQSAGSPRPTPIQYPGIYTPQSDLSLLSVHSPNRASSNIASGAPSSTSQYSSPLERRAANALASPSSRRNTISQHRDNYRLQADLRSDDRFTLGEPFTLDMLPSQQPQPQTTYSHISPQGSASSRILQNDLKVSGQGDFLRRRHIEPVGADLESSGISSGVRTYETDPRYRYPAPMRPFLPEMIIQGDPAVTATLARARSLRPDSRRLTQGYWESWGADAEGSIPGGGETTLRTSVADVSYLDRNERTRSRNYGDHQPHPYIDIPSTDRLIPGGSAPVVTPVNQRQQTIQSTISSNSLKSHGIFSPIPEEDDAYDGAFSSARDMSGVRFTQQPPASPSSQQSLWHFGRMAKSRLRTFRSPEGEDDQKRRCKEFEYQVRPLVERVLNDKCRVLGCSELLAIQLAHRGLTPEEVWPTVLISCQSPVTQRKVRKALKETKLHERFTYYRFEVVVSDVRLYNKETFPVCALVRGTGGTDQYDSVAGEIRNDSLYALNGAKIVIVSSLLEKGVIGEATIGGVVLVDGLPYGLTVQHVMEPKRQQKAPEKCYYGNDEGGEGYTDFDSDFDSDNSFLDGGGIPGSKDSNYTKEGCSRVADREPMGMPLRMRHPGSDLASRNHIAAEQHVNTAVPLHDASFCFEIDPNASAGKGLLTYQSSSPQDYRFPRDWALVQLKPDVASWQANRVYLPPKTNHGIKTIPSKEAAASSSPFIAGDSVSIELSQVVPIKEFQPSEVFIIAGNSGLTRGWISGTVCSIKLPGTDSFADCFPVQLDSELGFGDSGSWVIDANSYSVYGYVFAGSSSLQMAYVIPLQATFQDIEVTLRRSLVKLPNSQEMARIGHNLKATKYPDLSMPIDNIARFICRHPGCARDFPDVFARSYHEERFHYAVYQCFSPGCPSNEIGTTFENKLTFFNHIWNLHSSAIPRQLLRPQEAERFCNYLASRWLRYICLDCALSEVKGVLLENTGNSDHPAAIGRSDQILTWNRGKALGNRSADQDILVSGGNVWRGNIQSVNSGNSVTGGGNISPTPDPTKSQGPSRRRASREPTHHFQSTHQAIKPSDASISASPPEPFTARHALFPQTWQMPPSPPITAPSLSAPLSPSEIEDSMPTSLTFHEALTHAPCANQSSSCFFHPPMRDADKYSPSIRPPNDRGLSQIRKGSSALHSRLPIREQSCSLGRSVSGVRRRTPSPNERDNGRLVRVLHDRYSDYGSPTGSDLSAILTSNVIHRGHLTQRRGQRGTVEHGFPTPPPSVSSGTAKCSIISDGSRALSRAQYVPVVPGREPGAQALATSSTSNVHTGTGFIVLSMDPSCSLQAQYISPEQRFGSSNMNSIPENSFHILDADTDRVLVMPAKN